MWRRNWFGAAVQIAVGVIGLLSNFNLLPDRILDQIWKLWPLIPLAIGVSILIGRRHYFDGRPPRDPSSH